jgi:hypothetical protein
MAEDPEPGTTPRSEAAEGDSASKTRPRRRREESRDGDRRDRPRRSSDENASEPRRKRRAKRPSSDGDDHRADDEVTEERTDAEDEPDAAQDEEEPEAAQDEDEEDEEQAPPRRRPRVSAAQVIRSAKEQVEELTGRRVTGVIGFDRIDGGWEVRVEVLELKRVPETMSILGLISVQLDDDGELVGYRRLRRYAVSQTDEG